MEEKKNDTLREDARIVPQTAPAPAILPDLPEQELPEDIPAEVKEKLKADLAETKPDDIREDILSAEREELEDPDSQPDRLSKSRLLKLLMKKQYTELRAVT